ncbi:hypothetical protein YPC_2101 [Yersinia pestis biovar Medievalis str. Harbin 35]|nr:hypothetical protein YPC_2101 [Yersinia pestis biovar Medievalis str. Harbin 35]EEO76537.1 hypothetical protein YP516_2131 [Yersinia pestis Nepal516]EEO81502.1 hypothetical protein YPF_2228 [Yersinia pestis biovar Orientalis str. India 195]EEO90453.1 hypothetical protein YPS_2456 [Yersinia pestis Pestoides A]
MVKGSLQKQKSQSKIKRLTRGVSHGWGLKSD